jgi:hypothetical protein
MSFSSLSQGINYVGRLLGEAPAYRKFRETGNIELLTSIYCGQDCKGWASAVRETMEEI